MDFARLAQRRASAQMDMRADARAATDAHAGFDDRVRADNDVSRKLGGGINDGGGMDG
jgi:hypothetical protein